MTSDDEWFQWLCVIFQSSECAAVRTAVEKNEFCCSIDSKEMISAPVLRGSRTDDALLR